MKFYVASGFENIERVKKLGEDLQNKLHWQLTYDWTVNDRAETKEDLTEIGIKEYKAVMEADVTIVILPGGKGCHTELGIALGNKKIVILHDPEGVLQKLSEAITFYFLPQIIHWNGVVEELPALCSSSDHYCASL
ncbi:group-specific protein [Fictibacillus nanhaiensis]|uniref:group-specific protein n=1 Tax=Fictibacillus nanhaiensis TaxID=742169 RepID=UPI002E2228BB|nr:group-specific protein [Fictibacillus nanhaiensis]